MQRRGGKFFLEAEQKEASTIAHAELLHAAFP